MIAFTYLNFGVLAFIVLAAGMSLGASFGYVVGRYQK